MSDTKQSSPAEQPVVKAMFQSPNAPVVRLQLFNSGGAMLSVPIINKLTGDTDIVFVQHGGKPKLLPGYTVDSVFASRNPSLQVTKVTS